MGELGWEKILIIAVVALVLFGGGKKIPEMMRGLGRGVREFNDAKNGLNGKDSSSDKASKSEEITDLEHEPVK